MAYVETPRTDAGNATFMTNGHNLEDFSVENSFVAPSKNEDLLQQVRNGRVLNLRTPRTRNPLAERRNLPNGPKPGEFTPLLKSVAKNNFNRNNKLRGAPKTPAFLENGYKGSDTPALPETDSSRVYGEETASLAEGDNEGTPVPQVASSSAQSTPLALPQRDAGGVLTTEGNAMTLREQENVSSWEGNPLVLGCPLITGTDYQQDRKGEFWLKTQNTLPGRDAKESWPRV